MSHRISPKLVTVVSLSLVFLEYGNSAMSAAPKAPVIALTHATVIDGTGSPERGAMTVIISGSRLSAILPDANARIPAGAEIIDLTGKYVIPGLIDSHVHLGTQARDSGVIEGILNSVFMDGVTTVRDMGGSMKIVRPLAASSRGNAIPRPRIYYSAIMAGPGRWFEGAFGRNAAGGMEVGKSPLVQRVDGGTNVVTAIAAAKNAGATGIKIYNAVDPKLVRALAAEAHRVGLKVWSHFWVDPGRPMDIVLAGADVVSHADQFRPQLLSTGALGTDSTSRALRAEEVKWITAGAPGFNDMLAEMRRRGTMLDPTLTIMLPRERPADTSKTNIERVYRTFRFAAAMTRRALATGIPIVAGTDAIGGSTANLHAELQVLVDSAGLTPLQALRAATLNGALAVGSADSLGSLKAGKIADLVILCADPSADISNTQAIFAVIKGGTVYRRTKPRRPGPLARPPVRVC